MNYRMYTEQDMNEANMSMLEDISMEDDMEMHMPNGVHNHERPMYESMVPHDMPQMYETMPMYGNMKMDDMMPMNEEGTMHNMQNMMPCCMMNNMGVMPYMVELEEDEEDEECGDDIYDMVKKIEKHHPEILTVLSAYGIPYPVASKIIKRIVLLTLKHK